MVPSQAKAGDIVKHDPSGASVKIIGVDASGKFAMIRLENSNDWKFCPLADLSPSDVTAGSPVHTGPVSAKAMRSTLSADQLRMLETLESIEGLMWMAGPNGNVLKRGVIDETAIRKRAAETVPPLRKGEVRLLVDTFPLKKGAVGTPRDEQGFGDRVLVDFGFPGPNVRALVHKSHLEGFSNAAREEIRVGSPLIHKATNAPCQLIASSEEKNLFVVRLNSGCLEVAHAEELLTTSREPLANAAAGGTLRKMATSYEALKRGQRVRLLKTRREGIAELLGDRVWVKFADGSADAFGYEDLEAI